MDKINDQIDICLYNILESNSKHLLDELASLGESCNKTVEELYHRYVWLKKMDIDPNQIHLEQNHEDIYTIFDSLNKMLNEAGIEYYYTSGILSYLLVDKELERYHHDLDIFVRMEDLEILESISEYFGFTFKKVMGPRGDGTNRVMLKMYYKGDKEIPITVFMYVREQDESITQKDYFIDENGNRFVEYMYNSPEIVRLSFDDKDYIHNGIPYHSITLEALYLSKEGNRPKDIYDCLVFKDRVDFDKLTRLKEAYKSNKKNKVFPSESDPYSRFIFPQPHMIKEKKING